jgi:hypothetical protein
MSQAAGIPGAFRRFLLRGFAHSLGDPKNKNESLGPFNGVQVVETKGTHLPITIVLQRKQKRYKNTKMFFLWRGGGAGIVWGIFPFNL